MVERSDKRARECERRAAINATSGLQKEDERSESHHVLMLPFLAVRMCR